MYLNDLLMPNIDASVISFAHDTVIVIKGTTWDGAIAKTSNILGQYLIKSNYRAPENSALNNEVRN